MDTRNSIGPDIMCQTEPRRSLSDIRLCSWSELVITLKECQDSLLSANTSVILDCLIEKLLSPSASKIWWFKDLVFLNTVFVEKLVRTMVSRDLDHGMISKYLFHYQKSKLYGMKTAEKCEILETVIRLLCLLDARSVSFKGLFSVHRASSGVNMNKRHGHMLESMIGSQLDRATLDYLLVRSPKGTGCIYDVNMVLKLVKSFLRIFYQCRLPVSRLNKVGVLTDSYLAEIALDLQIEHSKFSALVVALPDCARESHDHLYQAIDMYFEVHSDLCEEARNSLCCALNYEKLSTDSLKLLATNSKFPSRISSRAFMSQSSKLTSLIREVYHTSKELSCGGDDDNKLCQNLHEDCQTVPKQSEMVYIRRSRMSASGHRRYLPNLCGC